MAVYEECFLKETEGKEQDNSNALILPVAKAQIGDNGIRKMMEVITQEDLNRIFVEDAKSWIGSTSHRFIK